jgi:peptidoglycan hydrolase-like protein with peptidoglycan-binding domain
MKLCFAVFAAILAVTSFSGCATYNQAKPSAREQELTAKVASLEEELRAKENETQIAMQDTESFSTPSVCVKPTTKRIQTALKNAGYYSGNVDGKVGKNTRKAIAAFQKANGLKGDGVVGNRTWQLLKKHL